MWLSHILAPMPLHTHAHRTRCNDHSTRKFASTYVLARTPYTILTQSSDRPMRRSIADARTTYNISSHTCPPQVSKDHCTPGHHMHTVPTYPMYVCLRTPLVRCIAYCKQFSNYCTHHVRLQDTDQISFAGTYCSIGRPTQSTGARIHRSHYSEVILPHHKGECTVTHRMRFDRERSVVAVSGTWHAFLFRYTPPMGVTRRLNPHIWVYYGLYRIETQRIRCQHIHV